MCLLSRGTEGLRRVAKVPWDSTTVGIYPYVEGVDAIAPVEVDHIRVAVGVKELVNGMVQVVSPLVVLVVHEALAAADHRQVAGASNLRASHK